MPPHPAVAAVRLAVRAVLADGSLHAERQPGRVLVACSGGADSLALAAAVAFEAPRIGVPAGLVTVDHGLQDGSAAQARRVASIAYELGFDPVEIVPVTVGPAGGPEGAARTARYAALTSVAQALEADVLLGHTLDDQAETVLLGLGRGSGPRSIAGMRTQSGRYLRPLLTVRRATTEAACTALGLEFWTDPQNADLALQRVRLRRDVLPVLDAALQGGVADALARTAALLHDDLDALDMLAAALFASSSRGPELDVAELAAAPRALSSRVLRAWALRRGAIEVTLVHNHAIAALVSDWHGQGPVDLPGGLQVRRVSGRLLAEPPSRGVSDARP